MSGGDPDLESRIVWLFGSPRSGSTWLMQMLGDHPRIMPINEPLIGYHLSPFLANDLGYHPEDLDLDTFTHRRAGGDDADRFFAEAFSEVWVPGLGRLLNERFDAHLARFAAGSPDEQIIVVKEPNGSQSADVIMRAQPRARLLFLLRDGRDVVDSALASNLVGSWGPRLVAHMRGVADAERLDFVTRFAYQWLWQTEVVQIAFARHQGPKHMVRYEDLLREPQRHVGELFEWLGLPLEQAEVATLVERFAFDRIRERGPRRFNRSATPGAWRENLRPEERAAVEEVLGAKLRELGYEEEAVSATVTSSDRPSSTATPPKGAGPKGAAPALAPRKLEAIDHAVDQLGIESFASLTMGPIGDQYAFYAIDKPTVRRGALIDIRARRAHDQLLTVIERAAEHPDMRVLDRKFSDPRTVADIGKVDAILLLDVLLRMVDPDWDKVLELYAPATSCFVISNPQWEGGEATVRLIDLGRERFLEVMPPRKRHGEVYDRRNDWNALEQRPYRDTPSIWQWGITDADLKAKMSELGFHLDREWRLGSPRGSEGFITQAFVFSRPGTAEGGHRKLSRMPEESPAGGRPPTP
jgi:Sulfotransferase family